MERPIHLVIVLAGGGLKDSFSAKQRGMEILLSAGISPHGIQDLGWEVSVRESCAARARELLLADAVCRTYVVMSEHASPTDPSK
jgi:hypothetical protein